MRRIKLQAWVVVVLAAVGGGCAAGPAGGAVPTRPTVSAATVSGDGVTLDGVPDEPAWRSAVPVALAIPGTGAAPREGGVVRLLQRGRVLYVAAQLDDRDVVNGADSPDDALFQFGDTFEVFLRPAGGDAYVELHVAPTGRRSSYFLPGPGWKGLPMTRQDVPFEAAAQVRGTLNDWRDTDAGWSVELAIDRDALRSLVPHDADARWTLLFGRYNFGRHLPSPELSAFPGLSAVNFHLVREFARLVPAAPAGNLEPSPDKVP